MVSKYTVVRYVPDVIAEEFINIGVITTAGDGIFMVRLTGNTRRLRAFAGDEAYSIITEDLAFSLPFLDNEEIDAMIDASGPYSDSCFQFTPWRHSLVEPSLLADQMMEVFVKS